MRFLFVLFLVIALLVVAFAVRAPATLIDRQVENATAGNVRLSDATGTIWEGAGFINVSPGGVRVPVKWKIDALPLLHGELSGTLIGSTNASNGAFSLDRGHATLKNISVSSPMDALLRSAGVPAPLNAAGGTLDVHIDTLTRRDNGIEGSFAATWSNASLPGPRADARYALGDIRVDASGNGPEIPGTVTNIGGDVDIKGAVTLTASGARADVTIAPRAGVDEMRTRDINAALSAVGQANGAGGFRLVWSGAVQ